MSQNHEGNAASEPRTVDPRTICDFGEQWELFPGNDGYFSSLDYLQDLIGCHMTCQEFQGKKVGEIGSGTGRWVPLLIEAGAEHVVAIEPSHSMNILKKNTKKIASSITYIQELGENIALSEELDYMISFGVLSYIPDPLPTFKAAYEALNPDGRFLITVMSLEGNRIYLCTFGLLRVITTRMPNNMLLALCRILNRCLSVYIALCKRFRLPLHEYVNNVVSKFSQENRLLIIFDQLNPTYAKYYRKREVEEFFLNSGFKNVKLHHRYGNGWTAIGEKPRDNK